MSFTPTPGMSAPTAVTVSGSDVTLPATNWRNLHDGKLVDVSNFRDGRQQAATLPDGDYSCDLIWDQAAEPNLAANGGIVVGASLAVVNNVGGTKKVTGTFMVSTVEWENAGVNAVLVYHVTGKLVGTLTPPT